MITLTAITAVALVAAPVWAAGGRMLSDRQLDNVHAGSAVSDQSNADANSAASHAGALFVAGAASSAAAATASDVASARAVKIDNKCATGECKLKITESVDNDGESNTGANAQTIVTTVASVNAVQINVSQAGGTQSNKAYSAEGVISEIDSAENGAASANSAGVLGSFGTGTGFASADSSASAATSASSTLAFATPRVEVKNRCDADNCKLKIYSNLRNNGDVNTGANAQSILTTVASVNAVQINVSATASAVQNNTAFSTLK
jgi:hypothetical protein